MAETSISQKRPREEEFLHLQQEEELKRPKPSSYNQILSILEEDEEEPNQDLSSLITSLQQEISSEPSSEPSNNATPNLTPSNSFQLSSSEDEEDKERVIRHLLEASDDELGIPNTDEEIHVGEDLFSGVINGGGEFEFSLSDDLWEFEDNTANYYTLLQSELFL